MKTRLSPKLLAAAFLGALAFTATIARAQVPLPSWSDTAPRKAILAFVRKVTQQGSADFVPVPERIATFDDDDWKQIFRFEKQSLTLREDPETKP